MVYPEPIINIFDSSVTWIADGLFVEKRPDKAANIKVLPLV